MSTTTLSSGPLAGENFFEPSSGPSREDDGGPALSPKLIQSLMERIYLRGDRILGRTLLFHTAIALILASAYQTWFVTILVSLSALGMFFVSRWLMPASAITRSLAGLSLQSFVALHIYQMHGLAEMHFFFFTALTVMLVYQDWSSMWLGAVALVIQHISFALLHNAGAEVYFFEQSYIGAMKLLYHFAIVLGHVCICSYWAHMLRKQTLASARQNLRLHDANAQLRNEMAERRQAEELRIAAENQLRRTTANTPGMAYRFLLKPDGSREFEYVSEGCLELFDVAPEQALASAEALFSMVSPKDIAALNESIASSAETLKRWTWEGRVELANGIHKWIQGVARPERTDDGSVFFDGFLMDVTERKDAAELLLAEVAERERVEQALREAQAHYQRVADNIPGMVYQFARKVDGAYAYVYVSEGIREVYELEPADAYHDVRSIFNYTVPADLPTLLNAIEDSAATLLPFRWEGRIRLPSGEEKWVQAANRPNARPDGTVLWDGIMVDVTELKNAEADLRAAKEEAERANLAKSEFLSRMSHELRTPLNAILGFGQLLEMEVQPPSQLHSVRHVLKAGQHLLSLINEVLDIARIEAGRLEISPEPIALRPLFEEVMTLVKPLAKPRNISLEIKPRPGVVAEPYVQADLQRLNQVLLNLLSNAIKYNCDFGGVTLYWEEAEQGRIRIAIQDTGRGIDESMLKRLFTPFDRLGAEHEGIEGSGIGLALSKRLVEAMGGTIRVQSAVGIGTTFAVEFPAAVAPEDSLQFSESLRSHPLHDMPAEEQPEPPVQRQNVLQIEDNPANQQVIERVLGYRPHLNLITAIQGQMGLALAREHHPEVILLDLNLPDLSGAEVLARLRADPQTADIPVIIVSADATPNQVQRLLALGAQEYLTKPLNLEKLLSVLDRMTAPVLA